MTTWDDFITLFNGLTNELEEMDRALSRMTTSFNNVSATYHQLSEYSKKVGV